MIGLFDKKKYPKLSLKLNSKYIKARPFPNIQIKNFLEKNVADKLYKSFPSYNKKNYWIEYNNDNTSKKKYNDYL